VVDIIKEHIAITEAKKLGLKVVALVDTNVNPELIDYPIPANDDAIRSIELFASRIADAVLEGKAAASASRNANDQKDGAKA
jgi:small subunit ribosomal protein S2